jgi:hypothetical protein
MDLKTLDDGETGCVTKNPQKCGINIAKPTCLPFDCYDWNTNPITKEHTQNVRKFHDTNTLYDAGGGCPKQQDADILATCPILEKVCPQITETCYILSIGGTATVEGDWTTQTVYKKRLESKSTCSSVIQRTEGGQFESSTDINCMSGADKIIKVNDTRAAEVAEAERAAEVAEAERAADVAEAERAADAERAQAEVAAMGEISNTSTEFLPMLSCERNLCEKGLYHGLGLGTPSLSWSWENCGRYHYCFEAGYDRSCEWTNWGSSEYHVSGPNVGERKGGYVCKPKLFKYPKCLTENNCFTGERCVQDANNYWGTCVRGEERGTGSNCRLEGAVTHNDGGTNVSTTDFTKVCVYANGSFSEAVWNSDKVQMCKNFCRAQVYEVSKTMGKHVGLQGFTKSFKGWERWNKTDDVDCACINTMHYYSGSPLFQGLTYSPPEP